MALLELVCVAGYDPAAPCIRGRYSTRLSYTQMKVIVCGGRDFKSPAQVWRALDRIHAATPITELMQGGARGVDTFAREWAAFRHPKKIKRYVCYADWDKHGRGAGPIRNARMLEWKPDRVIAFPGGNGTADMIAQAARAGVEVYHVDPREWRSHEESNPEPPDS